MNIKNILQSYGFEPEDKGQYYIIICPSCGKKEAFVYKKTSKIECNRKNKCGFFGDINEIIKTKNIKKSAKYFEDDLKEEIIPKENELIIPDGLHYFKENKNSIIENTAKDYLYNRGINNIKELGYIFEPNSFFNKTIFIPFYENKKLIYYICRDWTNNRFLNGKQLRYINPKGINASNYVYNIDKIKDEVFIFEGIFDALTLEKQIGTATLKSVASIKQIIKILDKNPKRIVFVPDNDEAGKNSININLKNFLKFKAPSQNIKFYIYLLKKVKDFNESGKKEIKIEDCIEIKNKKFIPELIEIKSPSYI